jgi:fused signal recognition particle receptor
VTPLVIGLLIAAVILVIGGAGYVVTKRRNVPLEPPSTRPKITPPAKAPIAKGTPADTPVVQPPVVQPPVVQPPVVQPPGKPPLQPEAGVEAPQDVDAVREPSVEEVQPEPIGERPKFRDRLTKARTLLGGYFGSVLGRSAIDSETWDELEEALIRADVGVGTTTALLDDLRARVKQEGIKDSSELLDALKTDLKKRLVVADRTLRFEPGRPNVWLFVGVNGVGKTTTIGKIARREIANGRTVVMAAGDTFRAAAAEQLGMWAERTGAQFVRGSEGGDPGSVIFDAVVMAASKNVELVLGDTAGRLQTKTNLMEELRKIRRVADREPGIVTEVLLVLDATTGQNGLVQAKQFSDVAELTGVVLTKLDGTAKGGIALAIQTELGIPIKLVGLGEGVDDLITFDPDEYVDALFAP